MEQMMKFNIYPSDCPGRSRDFSVRSWTCSCRSDANSKSCRFSDLSQCNSRLPSCYLHCEARVISRSKKAFTSFLQHRRNWQPTSLCVCSLLAAYIRSEALNVEVGVAGSNSPYSGSPYVCMCFNHCYDWYKLSLRSSVCGLTTTICRFGKLYVYSSCV